MIQKMKISDVKFETVNDYIIALGSYYTAIFGLVFVCSIYLIRKEWENSIVNTVR